MNNNIDISNESLQDTYKKYADEYNEGALYALEFRLMERGAEWQAQKDKAIIDKLTEWYEKFSEFGNNWEGRSTSAGQLLLASTRALLNQLNETI